MRKIEETENGEKTTTFELTNEDVEKALRQYVKFRNGTVEFKYKWGKHGDRWEGMEGATVKQVTKVRRSN